MLKAIIFDMDGVLVNSTEAIRKSFIQTLAKFGANIQEYDEKKYLGRSLPDQFKMWKEDFDIGETISLTDFSEEALRCQLKLIEGELSPNVGLQKLIHDAKNKGVKIAVGTSSFKKRSEIILELVGVYSHLDVLVSCEDVKNNKPSPDIFLRAAELINVEPHNCIVIEDAVNGIRAAKAGGMKSAGKVGPYHTSEELSIADLVFSDFNEINLSDLEALFID